MQKNPCENPGFLFCLCSPGRASRVECTSMADAEPTPPPVQKPRKKAGKMRKPQFLPPYHVILLDDNDHSYEYVMQMLRELFAHPLEEGFRIADEVNRSGRAIVLTTHKEKAELKRDQIHAFGADRLVATCKGSMSAIIQPAEAE